MISHCSRQPSSYPNWRRIPCSIWIFLLYSLMFYSRIALEHLSLSRIINWYLSLITSILCFLASYNFSWRVFSYVETNPYMSVLSNNFYFSSLRFFIASLNSFYSLLTSIVEFKIRFSNLTLFYVLGLTGLSFSSILLVM